ncbi:MAG: C-type lectin domain-containing protein [Deltaproteobacteria bacterium]|nr:C-type lectin domain-containing protein [Deltaproteobacteria bacterium]
MRTHVLALSPLVFVLLSCGGTTSNQANELFSFAPEPAGAHCPQGGVALQMGLDKNGDGVLQASEIDPSLTQYACNGKDGTPVVTNTQGLSSLVEATLEPAGANCAYGGERIDVGLDTSGDGRLQTSEITQTTFLCNRDPLIDVHVGDVFIDGPEDLAALAGVRIIGGDLRVRGPPGAKLELPNLEHLLGNLVIDGGALTNQNTPQNVPGLTTVSLPALVSVVNVFIYAQDDLVTLSLPQLTLNTSIYIVGALRFTTLDAPLLPGGSANQIVLTSAPALTKLSLPALADVDVLRVEGDTALTTVDLPKLTSVRTKLTFYGDTVFDRCSAAHLWNKLTTRPSQVAIEGDLTGTCLDSDLCGALPLSFSNGKLVECVTKGTWADGESTCLGLGGHLLWFESAAELEATQALTAGAAGFIQGWLGYNDVATPGTFVPTSGFSAYDPTKQTGFWGKDQPDAHNAYSALDANGFAFTGSKTDVARPLCRIPSH